MSSTYSNLKFELIATGEQSGSWGATTNTNIGTAIEQAIVGMATLATGDFTSNVATLSLSNTNALQNARALCLNITATLTAAGTINVPAIQKPYIIINNSVGGYAVTVKVSGQTGVSVPNGKRTVVYNDGTDVGNQINYLSTLTLGDVTGTIVGTTATQTLTNKTITFTDNTLTGVASTSTAQALTNKDLTSGTNTFPTTLATLTGAQTLTNKTITFTDNTLTGVASTSTSQTLTNKTLTTPTLTNPTVTDYIETVSAVGTVSTASTLSLSSGTVLTATLTASTACTFTMPTATAGKSFVLLLKQAATTGNGTATFTGVKWNSIGAPVITATAGKMDILSFVSDGTNWYGSYTQGYTP
jgi:hypothetical protein